MEIDKLLSLIIEEGRRMWRYRLLAIGCAWLIAAAGWLFVRALPDQYVSTARVYVSAETILKPLLQGLAVPTDTMAQVQLMTRALLSRPNLESVLTSTGMNARVTNQQQLEKLIEHLRRTVQVTKVPSEQIYVISYSDGDPELARAVVQTLLDDFIGNTLEQDVLESAEAKTFLEGQIAIYEKRLTEAEERLAEFKKSNMGMMPGNAGDFFARFQAAKAAAESLQFQISAQVNRRNELARQLSGESQRGSATDATSVDPAIRRLEEELAELRLRFTDKHPDVIRTSETLDDLKKLREEERRARAAGGPLANAARETDPVYQQLKVALGNAEAELAALQAQLGQRNAELAYLRGMVNTIPEIEAQLARLNRDYDVVKTEYETLIQRLNSLTLKQEVQQDNKGLTFRVIDPPRTPLVPAGPNRLLLNSLVLLAAIAAGLGLAFVLSQRDVTFYSATSLNHASGVPVFGVIGDATVLAPPRSWLFEIGIGLLLLVYGTLLVLEQT